MHLYTDKKEINIKKWMMINAFNLLYLVEVIIKFVINTKILKKELRERKSKNKHLKKSGRKINLKNEDPEITNEYDNCQNINTKNKTSLTRHFFETLKYERFFHYFNKISTILHGIYATFILFLFCFSDRIHSVCGFDSINKWFLNELKHFFVMKTMLITIFKIMMYMHDKKIRIKVERKKERKILVIADYFCRLYHFIKKSIIELILLILSMIATYAICVFSKYNYFYYMSIIK